MEDLRTIAERENLMRDVHPRRSGFMVRPAQQLAKRRKPRTMLDVECSHLLRSSFDTNAHGHAVLPYTLWLEAGKHEPPLPERPDSNYNSNVWRNFQHQYQFSTSAEGRNIDELIAAMYPVNVPAPSKVGEYTYAKFVKETPLFKDPKYKNLAIQKSQNDVQDFHRLRLQSDSRNPPIDTTGKILPPRNFKKYIPRFVKPTVEEKPSPRDELKRTDIFGARVKALQKPALWKLAYKLNNPEYERVQDMIQKRHDSSPQFPPAKSSIKV